LHGLWRATQQYNFKDNYHFIYRYPAFGGSPKPKDPASFNHPISKDVGFKTAIKSLHFIKFPKAVFRIPQPLSTSDFEQNPNNQIPLSTSLETSSAGTDLTAVLDFRSF
jgi:hypothetical protein